MALLADSNVRSNSLNFRGRSSHDAARYTHLPDSPGGNGQNDNSLADRPRRQGLQIPCAAIGRLFAIVDAAAIVLASLLGAKGYEFLVSGSPWNLHFHIGAGAAGALVYFLIGRSSGFYQVTEIFSAG